MCREETFEVAFSHLAVSSLSFFWSDFQCRLPGRYIHFLSTLPPQLSYYLYSSTLAMANNQEEQFIASLQEFVPLVRWVLYGASFHRIY